MTEETTVVKKERAIKNRYVRINKVIELYSAGTTNFEELIKVLSDFEAGITLRRGIKVLRDHKFYSKSVHWCLRTASKQGLITWTEVKKPRAKRTVAKAVEVITSSETPVVNNTASDELIPTL